MSDTREYVITVVDVTSKKRRVVYANTETVTSLGLWKKKSVDRIVLKFAAERMAQTAFKPSA